MALLLSLLGISGYLGIASSAKVSLIVPPVLVFSRLKVRIGEYIGVRDLVRLKTIEVLGVNRGGEFSVDGGSCSRLRGSSKY